MTTRSGLIMMFLLGLLTSCTTVEVPSEERAMPSYVPEAQRSGLGAASADTPKLGEAFEERRRTFSNGEALTYWVADGMVVEGDMILHDDVGALEAMLDAYEQALQGGTLESQAMFAYPHCVTQIIVCFHYTNSGRRWPDGRVYFDLEVLNDNFSTDQRNVIEEAMAHIERETDGTITFEGVAEDERKAHPNRIEFKREVDAGCYSRVGMVGGRQTLMLGSGCVVLGTVIHELGHALGLLHEHQRPIRDNHIEVNTNNLTSKGRSSFEPRLKAAWVYGDFDFLSIMMYPVSTDDISFVDDTRVPMFTVRPSVTLPDIPGTGRQLTVGEIGLLNVLSPGDIAALRSHYD